MSLFVCLINLKAEFYVTTRWRPALTKQAFFFTIFFWHIFYIDLSQLLNTFVYAHINILSMLVAVLTCDLPVCLSVLQNVKDDGWSCLEHFGKPVYCNLFLNMLVGL